MLAHLAGDFSPPKHKVKGTSLVFRDQAAVGGSTPPRWLEVPQGAARQSERLQRLSSLEATEGTPEGRAFVSPRFGGRAEGQFMTGFGALSWV